MFAQRHVYGVIAALGIAWIPACLSEPPEPPDAAHHVDELRATFVAAAPAAEQHVTAAAPVIGESAATGYAQTGDDLRAEGVSEPEVELVLPARAGGARRLHKGGVAIAARLRTASPALAEVTGGYVLYRDALGARSSVLAQVRADGMEDWFYFAERPAAEEIVYDLALEAGVGGLRLVGNTLEILDPAGVPRLRVNPPFAVGADGAAVAARLDVRGCAVDTDPSLPAAVRTPPGARSCEVGLSWTGVTYPALVDPAWVATTSMAYARVFPASSLVIDTDRVLVTGGYDLTGALTSAEIYRGSLGVWTATGSMTGKRYLHRQVLLGTGKVLVTGGLNYTSPVVASSEEYDPGTGTWIHPASMAAARYDFPLVLVVGQPVALGGWTAAGALAAAERYNPATHTWSAFPSLLTARGGAAAVSYDAGSFIVSGGYNSSGYLDSSELYNAATGAFWAGAPMAGKRAYHLANPVTGNPKVLVTGGDGPTGYLKTAEVYYGSFQFPDPGSWSPIQGMSVARQRHESLNLAPGRVMVCGGIQSTGAGNKSCEIFDSVTFGWSPTCDMTTSRVSFTMPGVPSISRALAAGGRAVTPSSSVQLSSAELGGCKDRCTIGTDPLASGSSSCVTSICTADPYCCTTAWDATCVREVRTICGSLGCSESDGACMHSLCTPGIALGSTCDSAEANCVSAICAVDPYCCSTAWDNICIGRVASVCGKGCN